jgi:hypothetical protein
MTWTILTKSTAFGCSLDAQVVGCSEGDVSSLHEALQAKQQGTHLVVLCTETPKPNQAGTPEAVAAELQQVQEAHDTVAQTGKRQLTIYAAVPEAAEVAQARRRLQGVQADVGTCGQLCQVRLLCNSCLCSGSKQ